jgi:hypothetical protein
MDLTPPLGGRGYIIAVLNRSLSLSCMHRNFLLFPRPSSLYLPPLLWDALDHRVLQGLPRAAALW